MTQGQAGSSTADSGVQSGSESPTQEKVSLHVVIALSQARHSLDFGDAGGGPLFLAFFENGKPKESSTYKLFKLKSKRNYGFTKDRTVLESKMHGAYVSYSGKDYGKTEEGGYKKGLKDGKWIAYHPGGVTYAVVSNYKKGELHGSMKQYNRRGRLLQQVEYKDGLKHGSFIMYDKNGKVFVKRHYADGMQIIEGETSSPGMFTPGK